MKERIKNEIIKIAGKNTTFLESKKSIEKREKKLFIEMLDELRKLQTLSDNLMEDYGINLFIYEQIYWDVIVKLIINKYGDDVGLVMVWWACDVLDPKSDENIIMDIDTEEKFIVKSPSQVYNALKKLKKI
jgi:hypothetical protein